MRSGDRGDRVVVAQLVLQVVGEQRAGEVEGVHPRLDPRRGEPAQRLPGRVMALVLREDGAFEERVGALQGGLVFGADVSRARG